VEAEIWNQFEDAESLRIDMDEAKGRRYEQACAQLVRSQLPAQLSQLKVLGREPIAVELEGNRPNTGLVFKYRDHAGNVHRHGHRLWPEKSNNAAHVPGPREVAGLLVVNLTEPGDL
jgi:hypothetical protein